MNSNHSAGALLLASLVSATTLGCALTEPRRSAHPGDEGHTAIAAAYAGADAQARQNMRAGYTRANEFPLMEEQFAARAEESTRRGFQLALGQVAVAPGMAPPRSASVAMKDLVAAKVPMRIVARKGGPLAVPGYDLVSPNLERAAVLERKVKEETATAAEKKEAARLFKTSGKLSDVKWEVLTLGMAAVEANTFVQTQTLQTTRDVRRRLAAYKISGLELDAGDYAWIGRRLAILRRGEAAAAATLGALAAMQAVADGAGDAKALDELSKASLASLASKPTVVTEAEARAYMASFSDHLAKSKEDYESAMRTVYGDAGYDAFYKVGIDQMFAMDAQVDANAEAFARNRQSLITTGRPAADAPTPYGPQPGAAAAPTPAGSPPPPGAATPQLTGAAMPGKIQDAAATAGGVMRGADALSRGDAQGLLDTAADLGPEGPFKESLQGVAALNRGDARGALRAALRLASHVPGGSTITAGLAVAGKVFGFQL